MLTPLCSPLQRSRLARLAAFAALFGALTVTSEAAADGPRQVKIKNRFRKNTFITVQNGRPGSGQVTGDHRSFVWTFEPIAGGFVRIRAHDGRYLHVENGPLALGAVPDSFWTSHWKLEPLGSFVRIRNRFRKDQYLNLEKQPLESSAVPAGFWTSHWVVSDVAPATDGVEVATMGLQALGIPEAVTTQLVDWTIEESKRLEQPVCWKATKPNTAGKPLSACRPGEVKDGALCYPKCKKGYTGVGPVCWQDCPASFKDTGGHCLKPQAYGRGGGYAAWDKGKCFKDHGRCEQNGLMWYPKCKAGYKAFGCCVCTPVCPSGTADIGVSCQKHSYGRSAGNPLICAAGQVQQGGLCYPPCPNTYYPVGPVCWQTCGEGHSTDCGAMCGQSSGQCVGEVGNMVLAVGVVVANIAGAALTGGAANAGIASAKAAVKTGAKAAAKAALKNAAKAAGRSIASKLRGQLGSRVIGYAVKKSARRGGRKLAEEYGEMVMQRAAEKIALAAISQENPELTEIVSMVDPTGVVDAVMAFVKPMCQPAPLPN